MQATKAQGVGATGMNMDAVSHSGPRSAVSLEVLGCVAAELPKLCSTLGLRALDSLQRRHCCSTCAWRHGKREARDTESLLLSARGVLPVAASVEVVGWEPINPMHQYEPCLAMLAHSRRAYGPGRTVDRSVPSLACAGVAERRHMPGHDTDE